MKQCTAARELTESIQRVYLRATQLGKAIDGPEGKERSERERRKRKN